MSKLNYFSGQGEVYILIEDKKHFIGNVSDFTLRHNGEFEFCSEQLSKENLDIFLGQKGEKGDNSYKYKLTPNMSVPLNIILEGINTANSNAPFVLHVKANITQVISEWKFINDYLSEFKMVGTWSDAGFEYGENVTTVPDVVVVANNDKFLTIRYRKTDEKSKISDDWEEFTIGKDHIVSIHYYLYDTVVKTTTGNIFIPYTSEIKKIFFQSFLKSPQPADQYTEQPIRYKHQESYTGCRLTDQRLV